MANFKSLYQALPLEKAIGPDDPHYVDYYGRGNAYGYSADPIAQLATSISFSDPEGRGLHLVSGQRGTGKSSELTRLKHILEADGFEVWFTDLEDLFVLSEPIEIGDFLIGATSALVSLGIDSGSDFFDRLRQFFQTEIEVEGLTVGADAAVFKAELDVMFRQNPTIRQRVREKLRARVDAIWRQTADYVEHLAASRNRRVVWIMDSIDRASGRFDNAAAVADSIVALFSQHADKLRFKHIDTVAVVHPWLSSATGAALIPTTSTFLPSIRVRQRTGEVDPLRIGLLVEIALRREPGLFALVERKHVEQLALMSGGDLREYFRLLRSCAIKGGAAAIEPPVSAAVVTDVINEQRNAMLPIAADELDWLRQISTSKQASLKTRGDVLALARLLNGKFVMNYRNGDDWYDVHPLLFDLL